MPADIVTIMRTEFPASADQLPIVRNELRNWLDRHVPDPGQAYDLLLAVGEGCTNSIEHGHLQDGRLICLEAIIEAGIVHITITDHGHWIPPRADPDPLRGRGLAMIRALVPDTRLTIHDTGTVLELSAAVIDGKSHD